MPNWVHQDLHVVGSEPDVDRFVSAGYRPRSAAQPDDLLDLLALCPRHRGDPGNGESHDSAVALMHCRTRTQAYFGLITALDYPADFYGRLPDCWPTLAFACSVNEDMDGFGGAIVAMNGEVINLVEDYGHAGYSRRAQSRRIRKAMDGWGRHLTAARDWRTVVQAPWKNRWMPFDAHFDDDFWFYFRSREDMAAFRESYRCWMPMRRVGGEWRRTRLPKATGS